MEMVKKIQENPHFPLIMAATSYTLLATTSAACLYYYFTQIASNDFWHWQLIAYIFMLANGITGYSEFLNEDSFFPLRELLDHCQVALVLPCYAAQMWVKNEMGPPEIAAVHIGLGILATIMYVTMEDKRRDLTDLAIFANAISLMAVTTSSINPIALIATSILVAGYCMFKRNDDMSYLAPQDNTFNLIMAAFALLSLASFEESITKEIKEPIENVLGLK